MNSMLSNTALRGCKAALTILAIAAMATAAHADSIISNGNFSTSSTVSSQIKQSSYTAGATLNGWDQRKRSLQLCICAEQPFSNSQYGN